MLSGINTRFFFPRTKKVAFISIHEPAIMNLGFMLIPCAVSSCLDFTPISPQRLFQAAQRILLSRRAWWLVHFKLAHIWCTHPTFFYFFGPSTPLLFCPALSLLPQAQLLGSLLLVLTDSIPIPSSLSSQLHTLTHVLLNAFPGSPAPVRWPQ